MNGRARRQPAWRLAVMLALVASRLMADDGGLESAPLAPRSGPRGATLFTRLAPEQTGIVTENNFADPKMWDQHYQELIFGELGTGVAIGDYDGDGRPDVFVVSKTESCRLFRNLGNWKFEDVTEKAGLSGSGGWSERAKNWIGLGRNSTADSPEWWKQGATFVDVNNDGRLDIYVCRFGAPNLLYINQGDGTFKEEAAARGLAVNDASGMAAFCDYDRDGWLDVFVHTNMLDAVAGPNGRRSYLFHNNGDGTFTNVTDRAGILGEASTHSATWWDYDNDGWPDLYVADDYAQPDRLYHNNRDGTFTNVLDRVVPHTPYYAMGADLGDVNNDGLIDLFVADMAATTHEKDFRGMASARVRSQLEPGDPAVAPQYMRNALYLNTGTGRVLEAAFLAGFPATNWTWSPRFEDLDNDGRLDLVVTNGMIREYHNSDLLERSVAAENISAQRQIVRLSPVLAEANLAYRNLGDLRFENVSAAWGLDQKGVSFGSAFGDLDGDGDLDLVYANYQGGVSVLRNDADSGHRLIVALRGTRSNRFGVGATVRIETASGVQVRQLVLARGYLSSSEPILHFGLGEDTRIQRLTVSWPSGQSQTFADLAVDRRVTITEPEIAAADAAVFLKQAKTPAPPPTQFAETTPPSSSSARANFPPPVKAGDVVAAADFDRDGQIDFFDAPRGSPRTYPLPPRCALFANRGGHLEDVTDAVAPALRDVGLVTAALWSDVDGDGWPDLLVAVEWGHVSYFHNDHGRAFEDWTEKSGFAAAGTGWWSALAAADFNGDGRLDYVAGNLGLNTRYHATAEFPALLFYGNFGGTAPLAIEAYYENGRLFPWITRSELGAKIPSVLKRFPKSDGYARATLGEILGEEKLAAARRFAATEFRSGVFLSQPDGTFRFEPLPRIAQIAPLRGIVAGDFDGDGQADIYAVQNSFSPPPSVGRFDGGVSQLLRGDGRGRFTPVPPAESGLVVAGEARAVAVLDFDNDGWPDFLVTGSGDTTRAFRNRGVSARKSLNVSLLGAAGNPNAIGAQVTVELLDGATQLSEISAGSAHSNQSSASCFFGYMPSNPPRLVRVRWPSGVTTQHPIESPTATITLHAP